MNQNKKERKEEIIRELSSKYIAEESGTKSMITVTHVFISENRRNTNIKVTVFPEEYEKEAVDFLKRKEKDLKWYIQKNSKMGIVPNCIIELDLGEKNRQRLDEISNQEV